MHIGTQHGAFGAKEIYKYSLSREDERKSLKKALEPLLALIAEINRLEQLSDRLHGGGGTEGGGGSDVGPTLGQVTERLTTARTTFERQLNTSRAEHPLVAALMLTLEPGFDDDALSKQTVILLDTMIRVAEKFEPPMSRVASLSRKPADWPTALYHGPEHWLADLLSLNRTRLEPLTHEPLLAELLNDEDAELDAFQYIVFMHYLKALGRGPEAARKAEQKFDANLAKVVRDLGLVNIALNFAAVFVPPLRPVVVALDAALTVYGAITMAKAALEFDATFRTAVQERLLAVAKNATINDLNELGQVLASAPSSEQLALMLLQAGISLRVTAATLRLFPTRWLGFLQKLDLVLSLT